MSESQPCPAVTGLSQCESHYDGAHRCFGDRHEAGYVHGCTCGYEWTCLSGSVDDLFELLKLSGVST
jgi:hypothetical protein